MSDSAIYHSMFPSKISLVPTVIILVVLAIQLTASSECGASKKKLDRMTKVFKTNCCTEHEPLTEKSKRTCEKAQKVMDSCQIGCNDNGKVPNPGDANSLQQDDMKVGQIPHELPSLKPSPKDALAWNPLPEEGWMPVKRNHFIDFPLDTTPLQIRIDGNFRDTKYLDRVDVSFHDQEGASAGNIVFYGYNDYPGYVEMGKCNGTKVLFPKDIPRSAAVQVWTITKTPEPHSRITLDCNGVRVADIAFSPDTCRSVAAEAWRRVPVQIKFWPADSASDFYRAAPMNAE